MKPRPSSNTPVCQEDGKETFEWLWLKMMTSKIGAILLQMLVCAVPLGITPGLSYRLRKTGSFGAIVFEKGIHLLVIK